MKLKHKLKSTLQGKRTGLASLLSFNGTFHTCNYEYREKLIFVKWETQTKNPAAFSVP